MQEGGSRVGVAAITISVRATDAVAIAVARVADANDFDKAPRCGAYVHVQVMMTGPPRKYPTTPDRRYFVVRGRLWRCSNPELSDERREQFVKMLMTARRTKDRAGIDAAKRALGERGPPWWDGKDYNRYLAKNTPYAQWFASLP